MYLGSYPEEFTVNDWDTSDYKYNLLFLLGKKKKTMMKAITGYALIAIIFFQQRFDKRFNFRQA